MSEQRRRARARRTEEPQEVCVPQEEYAELPQEEAYDAGDWAEEKRPPARKKSRKKKSGGNGCLIALIVLLIVLLAAVLGLFAFAAFGSGLPGFENFFGPAVTATPMPTATPTPTPTPTSTPTATPAPTPTPKINESRFESILLEEGSLLVKEFLDFEKIGDTGVNLQIATLTNAQTGNVYKALRVEFTYWESKYDNGEAVGVLDADEVSSVITSLEFIKEQMNKGVKDYTEFVYTASSGLKIGAFYSTESQRMYLEASGKKKYPDMNQIDAFISSLKRAQKELSQ